MTDVVDQTVLQLFAEMFPYCWICSSPIHLEIHHIVRGVHREKARCSREAMFRTCTICHGRDLDAMPVEKQLAFKALHDPEGYDRVSVNRLRCRADDAVSESDVMMEIHKLVRAKLNTGRWL